MCRKTRFDESVSEIFSNEKYCPMKNVNKSNKTLPNEGDGRTHHSSSRESTNRYGDETSATIGNGVATQGHIQTNNSIEEIHKII